jgi:hypothetical protein
VAYRTVQARRLPNLEIELGARLTAEDVRAADADIVVVATGSRWATDGLNSATRGPIPGADAVLAHVLTPEQIVLDGKRPPGRRVVVYDADGYFAGPAVAELLAGEGLAVELVTCHDQVAPFAAETLEDALTREHLHAAGVSMRRATTVTAVDAAGVDAVDEFGEPVRIDADGVVMVTQRVSDDALWRALDGLPNLYRIGDCVAPRLMAEAIFDGHRLAREIESRDPSVALPYLRERPGDTLTLGPNPGARAPQWDAAAPRRREVELMPGSAVEIAARLDPVLRAADGDLVIAAGRGAGADLEPYRRLADRYGGRFVVTRPQVEAGRATRLELVGASSETVAPAVYLGLGVSGSLAHVLGMAESARVIAVNLDPDAPIFGHADLGAVADAGDVARALESV